jgi:fructose-bisphosphate aldolase class II
VALTSTGELVRDATAVGTAVVAFNIITLEHAEAVIAGAEAVGVPVILQVSENAVQFRVGQLRPIAQAATALATAAAVPVALHLDHVTNLSLLRQAASAGFSSAMFDAGALSYADNLSATIQAVEWARSVGIWLEAELGYVGGKPDAPVNAHLPGVRTDPTEAEEFVAATGVDALAVAVGSSHAMTSRTAELDVKLIEQLAAAVPVPLALHGSSGVPDEQLRAAVAAGIRKVNVGTALNIACTAAIRNHLDHDPTAVDPRKYLSQARGAMAAAVAGFLDVIG